MRTEQLPFDDGVRTGLVVYWKRLQTFFIAVVISALALLTFWIPSTLMSFLRIQGLFSTILGVVMLLVTVSSLTPLFAQRKSQWSELPFARFLLLILVLLALLMSAVVVLQK